VDLVKSIIADLEKVISKLEKFETDEGINSSHKNFKFLDGLRNGTFDVLDELDKVLYKKTSDLSAVKPIIEKLSLRFQYTIEKVYPDNRNFGKINRLFKETYSDYKSL
jgi:hypothetical protein